MTREPTATPRSPKALLSVDQVAEAFGCSTKTIRRMLKRGDLPHIRIGKLIRIEPQALPVFQAQNRQGG